MIPTCAICTRHYHGRDEDCTDECNSVDADLGCICSKCAQQIRSDLDALVDLYALTAQLGPMTGVTGEGRAKSSPLPGGTDWIDWRHGQDLADILVTWVRDWMETYALNGPKNATLTGVTGWLRAHLNLAANSHPAIDEFANEMAQLVARGQRLVGEVPDRGQRVPCPTDDCGRTLRVRTAELQAVVTCKRCGIGRSAAQLLALAVRADAWVPAETAAEVAGVTTRSLRQWAERGHIGRSAEGYWLPSVREYVAAREAKRRARPAG